ncbi:MAG: hypothetical protein ACRCYY_16505 [Trueperaceae bacterium]
MHLAESLSGGRDKSYTILRVEFINSHPQIWYPGDRKHIIIQLGSECLNNLPQACYQLAYECIHLLSPIGKRGANNLEEGLATHFSQLYVREKFGSIFNSTLESYTNAQRYIQGLLAHDLNAIKNLRSRQPTISLIDAVLINEVYPDFGNVHALQLASTFIREGVT